MGIPVFLDVGFAFAEQGGSNFRSAQCVSYSSQATCELKQSAFLRFYHYHSVLDLQDFQLFPM